MILISISIALLALAAGMLLLDKTKKEALGNFFRYISWFIIIVSLLVIACELTRSAIRITCHHGHYDDHDMGMGHHGMRMMHGKGMRMDYCEEMRGGKKMRGYCCEMEDDDEDRDDVKKEIRKEIEIKTESDSAKK